MINQSGLIMEVPYDHALFHLNEFFSVSGKESYISDVHQPCPRKEINRWIN